MPHSSATDMAMAILDAIVHHPWRLGIDRQQYVSNLGAVRLALFGEEGATIRLWPTTFAPPQLFTDMPALAAVLVATNRLAAFDRFDEHLAKKKITVALRDPVETIFNNCARELIDHRENTTLLQHVAQSVEVAVRVTVSVPESRDFTIESQWWPLQNIFSFDQLEATIQSLDLQAA